MPPTQTFLFKKKNIFFCVYALITPSTRALLAQTSDVDMDERWFRFNAAGSYGTINISGYGEKRAAFAIQCQHGWMITTANSGLRGYGPQPDNMGDLWTFNTGHQNKMGFGISGTESTIFLKTTGVQGRSISEHFSGRWQRSSDGAMRGWWQAGDLWMLAVTGLTSNNPKNAAKKCSGLMTCGRYNFKSKPKWTWMKRINRTDLPRKYGVLWQIPWPSTTPGSRMGKFTANWVDSGGLWVYGRANESNTQKSKKKNDRQWYWTVSNLASTSWEWMSGDTIVNV